MSVELSYYETIIAECVAWVQSRIAPDLPPDGIGTAFFISSDLLVTCTHVIQGVADLYVQPYEASMPKAATVVRALDVEAGDLALLRVRDPDPDQKAVLLHILDPADFTGRRRVLLAGYPQDPLVQSGSFKRGYANAVSYSTNPATLTGISLEAGAEVEHGLSGSPVLDLATGTVIGITRYRKGVEADTGTGGGAIPVARAVGEFSQVRDFYDRPPRAAGVWLEKRSPEELRAIGREPRGTTGRLDLRLSGDLNEWFVDVAEVKSSEAEQQGTKPDGIVLDALKVDVARAVFQWTRGRGTSTSQDYQLVGEILSAALLRGKAATQYRAWRQAAEVLTVRLIAEPGCDLADLPWEYAKPSSEDDKRLGLDKNLGLDEKVALVRVMLGVGHTGPQPPPGSTATVVAMVVQPDAGKIEYPSVLDGNNNPVTWPRMSELRESIAKTIVKPLRLREDSVIPNPVMSGLKGLKGPCDILHYQGFVEATPDHTQVCIYDESGKRAFGVDISEFAELARRLSAKLVVLEAHAASRSVYSRDDPALSVAKPLLDAGVMAVLTTRFPVHPTQALRFNGNFYKFLAAGMTVEQAAQQSRIHFQWDDTLKAPATWGAFVLWTVDVPGLRLVTPPVQDSPAGGRRTGPESPGFMSSPSPASVQNRRAEAGTGGD